MQASRILLGVLCFSFLATSAIPSRTAEVCQIRHGGRRAASTRRSRASARSYSARAFRRVVFWKTSVSESAPSRDFPAAARRFSTPVWCAARPEPATRQLSSSMYTRAMKRRIYVDASVVGGCEDEEFAAHSLQLLESFVRGDFVLVVSTLTVQELAAAPDAVRRHLASVPEAHVETLQLDAEARELAEAYISEGVITAKMRVDAQHIAVATVARVDVLVSWNFKHIVNLFRIHGYNSVNLRRGYPTLEIRAPREVLLDD